MIKRLRAALTPQTAMLLAALLLAAALMSGRGGGASDLEARASRVLSGVGGAGKVRVVIATRSKGGKDAALGYRADREESAACGAVAVVEGECDPFLCAQLTQALCALLGLPASCVSVMAGG